MRVKVVLQKKEIRLIATSKPERNFLKYLASYKSNLKFVGSAIETKRGRETEVEVTFRPEDFLL